MKIATWNVNGIRARQADFLAWIAEARPDILCLQELKAAPDQVPSALLELDGYASCWHGLKAYSGVALLVRKETFPDPPRFSHPAFDMESRIVIAALGPLEPDQRKIEASDGEHPSRIGRRSPIRAPRAPEENPS